MFNILNLSQKKSCPAGIIDASFSKSYKIQLLNATEIPHTITAFINFLTILYQISISHFQHQSVRFYDNLSILFYFHHILHTIMCSLRYTTLLFNSLQCPTLKRLLQPNNIINTKKSPYLLLRYKVPKNIQGR